MDVTNSAALANEIPPREFSSSASQNTRLAGIGAIVYGTAWPDWMSALSPQSRVWDGVSGVRSVIMVPASPAPVIPAPPAEISQVVVLPLLEADIRNRPRAFPSLAPDERALDTFGDKAKFQAYVQENGLADLCPEHYPSPAEARFPCFLKRTALWAGQGIAAVEAAEELQSLLEQPPWQGQPYILQAMAEGEGEFVTHCVCKNGKILWHTSYYCMLPPGELIRHGTAAQSIYRATICETGLGHMQRFLEPLNYTGPCNIDYKLSADGRLQILEINPRLGGSLMLPPHMADLQAALSCIIENALQA